LHFVQKDLIMIKNFVIDDCLLPEIIKAIDAAESKLKMDVVYDEGYHLCLATKDVEWVLSRYRHNKDKLTVHVTDTFHECAYVLIFNSEEIEKRVTVQFIGPDDVFDDMAIVFFDGLKLIEAP
jgi:hypothetical protein